MRPGGGGGGVVEGGVICDGQLPTFDAESKSAKIPNSPCGRQGGGGGFMMANFQLLMLSPNLLKSQTAYAPWGEGGFMMANFQLLMLSPTLLKSQIAYAPWGGGGVVEGGVICDGQLPTFDAEPKSAKNPKFPMQLGGGGGVGDWPSNFCWVQIC